MYQIIDGCKSYEIHRRTVSKVLCIDCRLHHFLPQFLPQHVHDVDATNQFEVDLEKNSQGVDEPAYGFALNRAKLH